MEMSTLNDDATTAVMNTTPTVVDKAKVMQGMFMKSLEQNVGDNPGLALQLLQAFLVLYTMIYVGTMLFVAVKCDWKMPLYYAEHDRKT
uniref:Uncharacterized protein n=1 Tax=Ciona intestinalis TaxID=7719 RepID=F6VCR8_CIOIN